jgi:hypothetical protein
VLDLEIATRDCHEAGILYEVKIKNIEYQKSFAGMLFMGTKFITAYFANSK